MDSRDLDSGSLVVFRHIFLRMVLTIRPVAYFGNKSGASPKRNLGIKREDGDSVKWDGRR